MPCDWACEQVRWTLAVTERELVVRAAPTGPSLTPVSYYPAMAEKMWVGPESFIS